MCRQLSVPVPNRTWHLDFAPWLCLYYRTLCPVTLSAWSAKCKYVSYINRDMSCNQRFELQNKRHHEAEDCTRWRRVHVKKGRHVRWEITVHPLVVGETRRLSIVLYCTNQEWNMYFAKSGTYQGAGWTHVVIKHLPQSAVAKKERGNRQLTSPNTTLLHLTAILMKPVDRT